MFGWDNKPKKQLAVFLEIECVLKENPHTEEDEWYDRHAASNLRHVVQAATAYNEKRIVLIGQWPKGKEIGQIKNMLSECGLDTRLADDMEAFLCMEKKEAISSYLKQHEEVSNYVILDQEVNRELEVNFPFHCVFTHSTLKEADAVRLDRKLHYGTGWEHEYMFSGQDEVLDGFKKVIFLDIDGVLNQDRTSGKKDEEKIEIEYVDNLAEIVRRTGAEIILSSSWRYGMADMTGESLTETEKKLLMRMSERNMLIAGTTPTLKNGPEGRPLEIKQWLAKRQSVKSFVILDDEAFWCWNWLSPFVVTTSSHYTVGDVMKRHAGLEKMYIDEAVRILNQFDK